MRLCIVILLCVLDLPALVHGRADDDHFFETRIRPVLATRCFNCHGSTKSMKGLRLDSDAGLRQGGEDGTVVIPGDPGGSLLIRAIRYSEDRKMPPGQPLPADVVADFERWVADGARWPVTAIRSTSLSTSTIRSQLSTTVAVFPWIAMRVGNRRRKSFSRFFTPAASSTTTVTRCLADFTALVCLS